MPSNDDDILNDFNDCQAEFEFAQSVVIWNTITGKGHRSSVIRDVSLLPAGKQDEDMFVLRIAAAIYGTPYPETGDLISIDATDYRVMKRLDQGEAPAVVRILVASKYTSA